MTSNDPYFSLWDRVPDVRTGSTSGESDPSVPDGEHRARIVSFDCFESQKGDLWMKWTFAVLGGMFDGRVLVRLCAPLGRRQDDEDYRAKQVGWARQDLLRVLGEVPPVMGGLIDPETRRTGPVGVQILNAVVSVVKKTKGDRINVYINELIQASSGSAVPKFPDDDPNSWPDDEDRPPEAAEPDPGRAHDGKVDNEAGEIPF